MENMIRPEDEINYKNLIKNPVRMFGLVYPIILVLIIAIGIYWVYNLDTAFVNSIPSVNLKRDTVAVELIQQKGSVQAGVVIADVSNPTPELIAKGKELFTANCASCHGSEGKGDGIAGKALKPLPRNFTVADGWKNGRKLSEMWKTLEEGIPGGGMVSYNYMPVLDRFAIIHYIHSLMSEFPKNTPDELAQLDATYKLSEGKVNPNQIPVSKAMSVLLKENESKNNNVKSIADGFSKADEQTAVIINKVICNPERAVTTLLNSTNWRSGINSFYSEISSTPNVNGFKSEFMKLNQTDLNILYNYLLANIKIENSI